MFQLLTLHARSLRTRASCHTVLVAATMVVALLLCPALNRVVRVQLLGHTTAYTPSFQKSLDVPQDPHVLPPDTVWVVRVDVDLDAPRRASWLRLDDEAPPALPPLFSPRSLRAPPLSLL